MRAFVGVIACVAFVAVSACGGDPPPAAPTPAPPAFVRVDISVPASAGLAAPGDTLQLRAIASFDDGSRTDVTGEARWSVVNPAVVSVSPGGLVTAVGYGYSIVSAFYSNRAADANLAVSPELAPGVQIAGVVVDAVTRAPVVQARVRRNDQDYGVLTDGNGYFSVSVTRGPRRLVVSKVGYANTVIDVPEQDFPATLDVRLAPNPGSYIERTVEGRLEYDGSGLPQATQRIVMIAGGVLDADVTGLDCDYSPSLTIEARSAGLLFPGTELPNACYARVRLVAPVSEVVLTIRGWKVPRFRLTWREPR